MVDLCGRVVVWLTRLRVGFWGLKCGHECGDCPWCMTSKSEYPNMAFRVKLVEQKTGVGYCRAPCAPGLFIVM